MNATFPAEHLVPGRKLVFDASMLLRATGQAVGIVRVVRELARWAYENRDTVFVYFDLETGAYRLIEGRYLREIIDGRVFIDMSRQTDPFKKSQPWPHRMPRPLREPAFWLRNPRRRMVASLALHLQNGGRGKWLAAGLLERLVPPARRAEFTDPDGRFRIVVPYEHIAGFRVELDHRHFFLHASSDWPPAAIRSIARQKRAGLKVGFVNYDIIPLLYPDFFTRISARHFRAMYHNTLKVADMLFVTAEQIRNDVLDYCRSGRLPEPEIKVFQPGADLHIGAEVGSLPPGLAPGRYAIFVSTIEPRKGHGLLFAVWKRLLATGVPQATNFKLVFVGRRGWLVDDLIDIVKRHPSFGSSLLLLSGVSDNQLVALYRNAAFGLYPSMYEGYGLPVVELFAHGKAVLASTGGALKEVVGDLSPTLDPKDEDAWFEAMKNWIENPAARQPFEAAIRERFTHPSWRQASEAFFRILNESVSAADQMTGLGD